MAAAAGHGDEIPRAVLIRQLLDLGVERGRVLLVHTAFSEVGPVEGGPSGLIAALREALGSKGTLVMPSMADDDDHPFDPASTPCRSMGIVAETFRRLPDVTRSDSPHAFAATGPLAGRILAPHPVDLPHGPNSPVGRVYEEDGQVLLLGVGHHANTTIHLAENLAGVRYRLPARACVTRDGRPVLVYYEEVDHGCERFSLADEWLDAAGAQRRGTVGWGEARLMRSRAVADLVVERLRRDEAVFLHPPGHDEECDRARASIG